MQDTAASPHSLIIISLLAIVVALGLTLVKPVVGIHATVGLLILLVSLTSVRAAIYLLIFAMLLSPEIAVGVVRGRGTGGRDITLRLDDLLLVIIGFAWLTKTIVYRELAFLKSTVVNRPILYYMLACIAATLVGLLVGRVYPLAGFFFVLKYFEFFFLFFMVVNNITTRNELKQLLVALLVTCFLISLYAIAQIPTGERATAPFEGETGEPNTLGGYLVFCMAIAIGLLLHVKNVPTRVLLLLLLVFAGMGLMATLSRSSYLASVALILTVVFTQRQRPGVLAVVIFMALLLPIVAPENVRTRVSETFYGRVYGGEIKVGGVTLDLSTTERLRSWQRVLQDWSRQPLLGHGVTGYAWADAQYVKILGETGLVGLITFLFLISRLWKQTKQVFLAERDPLCKGLAHGFLLGMVALLTHAIGANTFIIVRIMEPFWLCAALVLLVPSLEGKQTTE